MSTLKVSNIQDTSGNNNCTPAIIANGTIKAWCRFDGTSANITATMTQYNVSSITDNAAGDYTVNFSTPMSNYNYAVSGAVGPGDISRGNFTYGATKTSAPYSPGPEGVSKLTTSCKISTGAGAAVADMGSVSVMILL